MKLILTYDEYMKLLDSTGVRDMVEKLIQDSIASKMGNLITENPVAPAAEGVDFGPLTAYAGDDAEAARGILESFAEQSAANCRLLDEALGSGDIAALKAVAHKMLPIFTMLGAAEVAEALRRAETCEGPLTETLCGELRAAVEKIRAIVAEAEKTLSL